MFNFFKKKEDPEIEYLKNKVRRLTYEAKIVNKTIRSEYNKKSICIDSDGTKSLFYFLTGLQKDITTTTDINVFKRVACGFIRKQEQEIKDQLSIINFNTCNNSEFEDAVHILDFSLHRFLRLYKMLTILCRVRKNVVNADIEKDSKLVIHSILLFMEDLVSNVIDSFTENNHIHFDKELTSDEVSLCKELKDLALRTDDYILYCYNNNFINYNDKQELKPTDLFFTEDGFSYTYENYMMTYMYIKEKNQDIDTAYYNLVKYKLVSILLLSKYAEMSE